MSESPCATLREEIQGVRLLATLGDQPFLKVNCWRLVQSALIGAHVRVSLRWLPSAWLIHQDPTQVDGRIKATGMVFDRVNGLRGNPRIKFEIPHTDVSFVLDIDDVIEAIIDGEMQDSS